MAPTAFTAATQLTPGAAVVAMEVVVVVVVVVMVVEAAVVVGGASARQAPTMLNASERSTTRDRMHRVCSSKDSSKRSLLQPPMTRFVRLNQAATDFQPYCGVLKKFSPMLATLDS